jgi:hypothetical protein
MSVRLGISPIGWSNDDLPELGGDIPLVTWFHVSTSPNRRSSSQNACQ